MRRLFGKAKETAPAATLDDAVSSVRTTYRLFHLLVLRVTETHAPNLRCLASPRSSTSGAARLKRK